MVTIIFQGKQKKEKPFNALNSSSKLDKSGKNNIIGDFLKFKLI